jgi:hypothetical protein
MPPLRASAPKPRADAAKAARDFLFMKEGDARLTPSNGLMEKVPNPQPN